jgi:hypothetical protein
MTDEMKGLQKEINGKVVRWINKAWPTTAIDVILLWEPDNHIVSVKPFGYDPEELYMLLNDDGVREYYSLDDLYAPEFCVAEHPVYEAMGAVKRLSNLKDGEYYIFDKVVGGERVGIGDPSCPYGLSP